MNIVAIVGNVASEPELRHTSQGRAICTFRIAVSRPGSEEADFFTVAAWERQAEVCNEYLGIGRRIAVDGRMHCRIEDEPDGTRASRIEIVAHRIDLFGRTTETAKPAEVVA